MSDDDMLRGTTAIAAHLRESVRRAQYLLETRQIPAFKVGDRWHMRPSAYRRFIEELEAPAIAEAIAKAPRSRPAKVA